MGVGERASRIQMRHFPCLISPLKPINQSINKLIHKNRSLKHPSSRSLSLYHVQLQSTQSANQSLQRQLLEATLPIDGASDPNDSSKPVKPARSQHHASAPSIGRGDSSPISGRPAAGDDIKEREKEVLALKKQIADAHNLCQVSSKAR